ncbi:HD domain-containing protein [Thorsellia anophelis]|uniref:Phosphonate degradation operons associated HDIG domain protein n=1 Tax=Thorsellia anophelis DSM 18579 TaxID=1123402 RepID=A0A1H9YFH0_9GAMM|nr:HD domain-containing protein [Thorsellia anophelis]SES67654.1 phosphonate degradation operons associated HDIG domain protein [Thorsellia anophelis DSM 18579]
MPTINQQPINLSLMPFNSIEEIKVLMNSFGDTQYYGSPVSQLEHALQSAMLAQEAGENAKLITASLLHDLGHLVLYSNQIRNEIKTNQDYQHQELIATLLVNLFDEEVIEPIRLHVDAKRYLCAVNPLYEEQLSPDSIHSLELQGGRFNEEEVEAFRSNVHFEDAVKLRLWDDEAKTPNTITPSLDYFLSIAESIKKIRN